MVCVCRWVGAAFRASKGGRARTGHTRTHPCSSAPWPPPCGPCVDVRAHAAVCQSPTPFHHQPTSPPSAPSPHSLSRPPPHHHQPTNPSLPSPPLNHSTTHAPVRRPVQGRHPVLVRRVRVRPRLQQLLSPSSWVGKWVGGLGGWLGEEEGGGNHAAVLMMLPFPHPIPSFLPSYTYACTHACISLTRTALSCPFPAAQCRGV